MKIGIAIVAGLIALPAHSSQCAGIDRVLPKTKQAAFAPAIQKHLNQKLSARIATRIVIKPADVLQLFRDGKWHIVYVNTSIGDEQFLFYSSSPEVSVGYVLAFSGGAAMDEGPAMRKWVIANAPGIPHKLAGCFAWHVTQARDM